MRFRFDVYRRQLLQAIGVLPLAAAVGCEAEPLDGADAVGGEELPDGALPPPVTLSQAGDLLAGQGITFTISGVTPGASVILAGSPTQGPGPCLAGGAPCLSIANPKVIGRGTASATGRLSLDVTLPHQLPEGAPMHFQAADLSARALSAVLTDTVVYPQRVCGDYPWLDPNTYATEPEVLACAPLPAGGVCPSPNAISYNQWDWIWRHDTGVPSQQAWGGYSLYGDCLETTVEDGCCYHAYVSAFAIGRPFEVAGAARLAAPACDDGWASDQAPALDALSGAQRERLAAAWLRTARGEHASIAAFARFVLQLTHLGAPAELVAEATRAMADEIRHARDAFGVASAFAGEALGAGPLDARGALDALDVASIVRATVREGCVAETISAAQAAIARDACADPALRALLAGVAEDEARHAALAWRFVRWAIGRDESLRAVVEAELARPLELPEAAPEADAGLLRAFGVMPDDELNATAREIHARVVTPCGRALLAVPEDQPAA